MVVVSVALHFQPAFVPKAFLFVDSSFLITFLRYYYIYLVVLSYYDNLYYIVIVWLMQYLLLVTAFHPCGMLAMNRILISDLLMLIDGWSRIKSLIILSILYYFFLFPLDVVTNLKPFAHKEYIWMKKKISFFFHRNSPFFPFFKIMNG